MSSTVDPIRNLALRIVFSAAAFVCPPTTAQLRGLLAGPDVVGLTPRGTAQAVGTLWQQDVTLLRRTDLGLMRQVVARLHFVAEADRCTLVRFERLGEKLLNATLATPTSAQLLALARTAIGPELFGDDRARVSDVAALAIADDPDRRWRDVDRFSLRLYLTYDYRLDACRVARLSRVAHETTFRYADARWHLIALRRIDTRDPWTDFPTIAAPAPGADCPAFAATPSS